MKKKNLIIGLLACLAIANNVQAQEEGNAYLEIPTRTRGFQVTVEGGKMNFADDMKEEYSYNGGHLYGVLGYKINQKVSAGFGLGFDAVEMRYSNAIQSLKLNNTTGEIGRMVSWLSEDMGVFKLFARGQYRFIDKRFSPFVACDLGVRFTLGLQDIYGEDWIFDEDEAWRIPNREEYIAGSLTQLLGKPSVMNVFATPTIGFSLRTTNNSYLELKAGYTLSPYAMGVRKSTDYTFNNEQITHIASCRPIKMSAPFVSLTFTHTFRYWSDLDESLYDATRARKREQRLQNLDKALAITGAVLGAAAAVAGTVNAVQNNSGDIQTSNNQVSENEDASRKAEIGNKNKEIAKKHREEAKKSRVADLLNDQGEDRTYQSYIGQLIDMRAYPERYEGRFTEERISIQKEMKNIRERVNKRNGKTVIKKSPWEDWDGDLRNYPR